LFDLKLRKDKSYDETKGASATAKGISVVMATAFSELIQSNQPTLVDFSAEWCGPCKMMAPILSELKNAVGDKAKIIKIDIDRNPKVASAYQVQSVPTLMIFKKGNVVWRQSGVVTTEHLKRAIEQHTS
jgi:thioredoxin 1